MEIDYFKIQLQDYLKKEGFDLENRDVTAKLDSNVKTAGDTFTRLRRNGYSVNGAIEVAVRDLYDDIGESPRSVLSRILVSRFADRINVPDTVFLDFWVDNLTSGNDLLQPFKVSETGIGLDPRVNDDREEELVDAIDQYLTTNGL